MSYLIETAIPTDGPEILNLIKDLAIYERAEEEMILTLNQLMEDGFGASKIFTCFVARENNFLLGIALVYEKYSTWKGRCIYLEDIIVKENQRGRGIGKSLFKEVIKYAKNQHAGRLEWQVLDWNEPAIGFYKKFNATFDPTWINCQFTAQQLSEISIESL